MRRLAGAAFVTFCLAAALRADERILGYDATIQVREDGRIDVTERITARSEAQRIRHGLYRDLPTTYTAPGYEGAVAAFFPWRTPFRFLAAERDGQPEPWFKKALGDGQRVYLGAKDVTLEPGVYRYSLHYRYDRILKHLPDHDELYWNVTGNGWDFPLDAVSATVLLPAEPSGALRLEAYTGPQGARGTDYQAQDLGGGQARFQTTRALREREGLSIVVGWPQGLVTPPSLWRSLAWRLNDWREALLALGAGAAIFVLLLLQWMRHGVDPEPRPLVPLFKAPRALPPAALRYLDGRGADAVGLSATLLQMAVQGRAKLVRPKKGWELTREDGKALDGLEQSLDRSLWPGGTGTVSTERAGHKGRFESALIKHSAAVMGDFKADIQFNLKHQAMGWLAALAFLVLGALGAAKPVDAGAFGAFVLVVAALSGGLLAGVRDAWRPGRIGVRWGLLIGLSLSGAACLALAVGLVSAMALGLGFPWLALQAFISGLLLGAYVVWMPRPSEDLQRLRDEIAGFTHYLGVAEQDRLERLHPPELTPQLFERFLPYALALGVANQWSERFKDVLAAAVKAGTYAPLWYVGPDFDRGFNSRSFKSFSDGLSQGLSSSISTASTPPPSGGGSGFSGGGGGGSGGGGGGGGGGGW